MAKMIARMGKVTYTDSNGQVIEFEPNQVEYNYQAPDRYFSGGNVSAFEIPNNLVDITIEGTFRNGIFQAYHTKWCGSDKWATISSNEYIELDHSDIKYGYAELKERSKMKIGMQWLTSEQLEDTDLPAGMLFLYENRGNIFGTEKAVVDNLTVMVINGKLPRELNLEDYAGGMLVTGFKVPNANHPIINTILAPAIHKRGTKEQNNPRTIYEYMSDETYGLGLYVGLTVHDVLGSWSSWPVHEYEINALTAPIGLYPDFSEKFAFITQPMGNWGLQARSQVNGDKTVLKFKDGDIIDIPLGAHPSVAGPATRLAYFWAYSGAPRKDF
jgi:hypothetical protein